MVAEKSPDSDAPEAAAPETPPAPEPKKGPGRPPKPKDETPAPPAPPAGPPTAMVVPPPVPASVPMPRPPLPDKAMAVLDANRELAGALAIVVSAGGAAERVRPDLIRTLMWAGLLGSDGTIQPAATRFFADLMERPEPVRSRSVGAPCSRCQSRETTAQSSRMEGKIRVRWHRCRRCHYRFKTTEDSAPAAAASS